MLAKNQRNGRLSQAKRSALVRAALREARRQHRVEREGDEQREHDRRDDRDAELAEELPDHALHEGDRQEHRDDGGGGREHDQRDLLGAVERGLQRRACPRSRCLKMFSRTTTASSMSRPIASDSASSVIMFSV